eukprot:7376859-Prymnesium_polylepis.2
MSGHTRAPPRARSPIVKSASPTSPFVSIPLKLSQTDYESLVCAHLHVHCRSQTSTQTRVTSGPSAKETRFSQITAARRIRARALQESASPQHGPSTLSLVSIRTA